jgi:hypothetical protein
MVRHNLAQQVAADLFGISHSTDSRAFRYLLPIPGMVMMRDRTRLADALAYGVALIDGTLADVSDLVPGRRHNSAALDPVGWGYHIRAVASFRAPVERAIGPLKQWILMTGPRGRLAELPMVIRTIVKLECYRLTGRITLLDPPNLPPGEFSVGLIEEPSGRADGDILEAFPCDGGHP